MFTRALLSFSLLICIEASAQTPYPPFGVLRVNEQLIADQTEILVCEWLGYIISVCDTNPTRFLKVERKLAESDLAYLRNFRYPDSLLPDKNILSTLPWYDLLDTTKGYRTLKFRGSNSRQTIAVNSEYLSSKEKRWQLQYWLHLPITGITFEQAEAYCRWRTRIDSLQHLKPWEPHYVFRLPTAAEFALLNKQFDSTLTKLQYMGIFFAIKVRPVGFNYKNAPPVYLDPLSHSNDLQAGFEYGPDKYEFYNIQGNAAEMTSTKGVACGGSYFHYAIDSYHNRTQVYEHPERWLGFRCVAEIAEKRE